MTPVRILLVDDATSDAGSTRRALERGPIRDAVLVAPDGPQALDYLFGRGRYHGRDITEQPQVVLLDMNGPGPGMDVLKAIRADHRTRLLPVVILTSAQEEGHLLRGYRHGANSYVIKPADGTELDDLVGQLARYWLRVNQRPPADCD